MMKILGVTLSNTISFNIHIDIVLLRQAAKFIGMLSECFVCTVSLGKPFGTSHALPHKPECYMHHPVSWGYVDNMGHRQWLQNFKFKLQRLGFCHIIPPHSRINTTYYLLAQLAPTSGQKLHNHLRPRVAQSISTSC